VAVARKLLCVLDAMLTTSTAYKLITTKSASSPQQGEPTKTEPNEVSGSERATGGAQAGGRDDQKTTPHRSLRADPEPTVVRGHGMVASLGWRLNGDMGAIR
jgi:hypothetical protein